MPLLYIHLTWTTLDRAPMITAGVRDFLTEFIPAEAARHGARVLAIGIVVDHVHVIVEAPMRWDLPRMMMGFKGASSCEVNKRSELSRVGLRWAKGYDARSVSPGHLRQVIAYVQGQPGHHPDRAIRA